MIKYSLICEFLHSFEAWFSSSASFEKQCDLNLVTCPECGNSKIRRALMTPNLSAGYNEKKHSKVEGSHSDATASEEGIMDGQDHSKTSQITKRSNLSSNNQINSVQVMTMLRNIRNYFEATRYHSLVVDRKKLPRKLIITAETKNKTIMGLMHKDYDIHGFQFHPESISTKVGMKLIKNFIIN